MELCGHGTLSEHPQLYPGAKPLVGLYYFDIFETWNTWFFTPIAGILKPTLRRYPRVKTILNVEFRGSAEDFHSCMTLFHSNSMLGKKVI